jgi:8-oxo-dGTP pyrophosphatase MutT (NUDIX family)
MSDPVPRHSWTETRDRIRRGLAAPLPGAAAQNTMAPIPPRGRAGEGQGRLAAALILLYPRRGGETHLVLTARNRDLPKHGGQISLPGGVVETGESLPDAAVRETTEEIGVAATAIRVLGPLTPVFIPPSGFLLHAFVGVTAHPPVFRANLEEVARILEVPLADLLDPATRYTEEREILGDRVRIPTFRLDGERVWGATAMILAEFLAVLERGRI